MKKSFIFIVLALFTITSAAQWSEQLSGVTTTLYSVSAIDNNTAWICGAGGRVLHTTNGGANWQDEITSPNSALDLYNIWGIDATTAIVTGSSSSTTYVYKTTNNTTSWTQVFSEAGGFIDAIGGLSETDPNALFMYGDPVGGRWSLWHSSDAGSTWDSTGWYLPQAGTETGYNNAGAIYRYSNNMSMIWFGTNNTRIYRWSSWEGWVSQPTTGQANSLAIQFMGDTVNGVAGGSSGMLYTSNGGTNWINSTTVPGSGSINGFAAVGFGEMFYTRGTSVYHTTNSGVNWVAATTQTGTYYHMRRARTQDNFNIWAIRNNGGISKYTHPIGIKPISSEVPNSYTLHQNYPNPFNPVTKIKFDIPKSAFTEMKIYDNLGREVYTLVSERMTAGKYEVEWNAANWPSGVYYYSLVSGDYTASRKMVLVK